jgi:hypothetical protein
MNSSVAHEGWFASPSARNDATGSSLRGAIRAFTPSSTGYGAEAIQTFEVVRHD